MNIRRNTTLLVQLALLTAAALVLGYVESSFPVAGLPGVKLGLSNTVLLYALYLMNWKCACVLMVLKVLLSGLLFGGPVAMMYSMAGGALSIAVMILLQRLRIFSIVGVSVCGAVCHNIGQILVACFVVKRQALLAYLPVLLVSAVITGMLTGVVAKYVVKVMRSKDRRSSNTVMDASHIHQDTDKDEGGHNHETH